MPNSELMKMTKMYGLKWLWNLLCSVNIFINYRCWSSIFFHPNQFWMYSELRNCYWDVGIDHLTLAFAPRFTCADMYETCAGLKWLYWYNLFGIAKSVWFSYQIRNDPSWFTLQIYFIEKNSLGDYTQWRHRLNMVLGHRPWTTCVRHL